ncbi:ThiF family adenylyltransferase [Parafilimonas sp.]|uniref:ThiF family adenylyltransferase n=1 Tax=Parafilimonas sp. TaxID=1969739 RepID=UPI003F7F2D83
MNNRYIRNNIYITENQQEVIRDFKVLIAGCGIGSVIAECILRLGFENITIIDGDEVEESNLNRQNYLEADIGNNKAIALKQRLLSINPEAKIEALPYYITVENLKELNIVHQVAINALDFSTGVPFLFDELCCEKGIPVIHPYNLGWAGFVTIITEESNKVKSLDSNKSVFELNIGAFIIDALKKHNYPTAWFENFLNKYEKISANTPPSQLSIGVNILAGMVSHIIFNIATEKPFKVFPEFYYLSIHE